MASLFQGKWVKLDQPKGSGPGARSSHAVTVIGHKAYVFGGEFSPRVPVDNSLHIFNLKTLTWTIAEATGDIPPPRVGVTLAAIGSTLFIFGGRDASHTELSELYSFDTSSNKWTLLTSSSSDSYVGPANRSYHSMTADDQRLYVFGGCGVEGRLNDLWAYDVNSGWIQLPTPNCKGRGGPGLAVCGSKIWVVYGFAGQEMDDVHCFDQVKGEWAEVETTGEKPNPRSVFSTAVIGGRWIVVYGGEVDPSDLGHLGAGMFAGDGYVLDTETGVWVRFEDGDDDEANHPGPRGWCAYSGGCLDGKDGLLVYGGNSPSNDRLGDLFFFTPCLSGN